MCITIHCKICNTPFPFTNPRQTICDNPQCRKVVRKNKPDYRTNPNRFCRICGKQIPLGSKRRNYCSKECNEIGDKNRRVSIWKARRKNRQLTTRDYGNQVRDGKGRFVKV